MIDPKRLDHFVARFMDHLSENITERKEDLVTLLSLLPKSYPHRQQIREVLEYIHAHELEQLKFRDLLTPATPTPKNHES